MSEEMYILSSGDVYWSGKDTGDMWEEIGNLQYDYLVEQGLKPEHKLLDIGCGSLRGGVRFIPYLFSGNYYGVDKAEWLLLAAREVEMPKHGIDEDSVQLVCREDFDFSEFGVEFDYMLAQSVFTHIPEADIMQCFKGVSGSLGPDGKFYATFFEGRADQGSIRQCDEVISYPHRDPYHYTFDKLAGLAYEFGLESEFIGQWNHPRNQQLMVFYLP